MKKLIIYYSYSGNTERIARMIKDKIGDADVARIETQQPYTGDYDSVVEQGKRETESGYSPEIKPLNINLDDYDTIIIGTPVWWYTFAPAVKTFLESSDLADKTVYPFATNGGWIGHTFKDFSEKCVGADVKTGINIRFDEDTLRTSESEINEWISKIK